ncbi:MAG: hypothetical protein R8M11_04445, partial [Gallionella sp.]
ANTLLGGTGNDTLNGLSGADRLYGEEGADTLIVSSADLPTVAIIDGGVDASIDTLQVTGIGAGGSLALNTFDTKVTSIETLDIQDGDNSTLSFGLSEIQEMVGNGNASSLTIRMDSGDIMNFTFGANETVDNNFDNTFGITQYVFSDSVTLATATIDLVAV